MHTLDSPDLVAPLGHYSYTTVHNGTVHVSGLLPLDAQGRPLAAEGFAAQARQVLHNLDRCLDAAGTTRQRLVSVTAYVTDLDQWGAFDAEYAAWIGDHRPARAVVGVARLHYDCQLEIQAVASAFTEEEAARDNAS
ncbi:RidA family protein [Mycolicibacterium goodii]|uniref:Endoribonuclease L-PSP n=1 Tax=Mycolicibacterium goodii TaxID=134601 RepID=A0A0K0X0H8_MYCGD|nr:endoribonuclease L-PSP [Mycolicibacterium goodii]